MRQPLSPGPRALLGPVVDPHRRDPRQVDVGLLDADVIITGRIRQTPHSPFLTCQAKYLSQNLEKGLPLFAEVLLSPAFEPEKVEVERSKLAEGLKRQNEDLFGAAQR